MLTHVLQENRTYQRILLSEESENKLEAEGFTPLFSSNVSATAVRGADLIIRFHNGSIYRYFGKGKDYLKLVGAASSGKWVWRFLRRPQVPYAKIGDLPLPEDTDETDEDIIKPRIPTYEVRAIVPTDDEKLKGVLPQIKIAPLKTVGASDIKLSQDTKILMMADVTISNRVPFFLTNKKWYTRKDDVFTLTKEAPKEAIESFNEYTKATTN